MKHPANPAFPAKIALKMPFWVSQEKGFLFFPAFPARDSPDSEAFFSF
jgi:hypothetical protein